MWRAGILVLLVCAFPARGESSLRPLLDAIRQVETGGHPNGGANAIGDEGRSLGPYQIQWRYWRDSGVPGRYEDVRSAAYAERVMVNYWRRYCPGALSGGDWQTLARIHNGGPLGSGNSRTWIYWQKVRREVDRRR